MIISIKLIRAIEAELKKQKALLELLISREENYNDDLSNEKSFVESSINYYEKLLKEVG